MIKDALDRKLVVGNVIALNKVMHCGMVFAGVHVVTGIDAKGSTFTVDLMPYQGASDQANRQLGGIVLGEKCYFNGGMVLKLAENLTEILF